MHAAVRHGTCSLTPLSTDSEVSCEVRPPKSPIRSLTPPDLIRPDEDCITHSAVLQHVGQRVMFKEVENSEL